MRCYICNTPLDDPKFDHENKTLPCGSCQAVIDDTIAGYGYEDYEDFEELLMEIEE